jgi:hypothetical protein
MKFRFECLWVRNQVSIGLAMVALAMAMASPKVSAEPPQSVEPLGEFTFPEIAIRTSVNTILPDAIDNDRHVKLGGLSDLWRAPSDPDGEFWIVTDRAPNGTATVDGQKRRTFPVPGFTPLILHARIDNASHELRLIRTIPIIGRSGKPVTGLPNLATSDAEGFNFEGTQLLPFNPNGLDTEGLVRVPDGTFWLAEEYRPSIVKVDAHGKVMRRFIPKGVKLDGTDYDVAAALPAVYAKRQDNRGFEGLAISEDGKTVFAGLQSPLENPDKKAAQKSRNTRILAFDTAQEQPTAEYVYQFDVAKDFEPDARPRDMKIGAMAVAGPNKMLVLERTNKVAKIYLVDFASATNILGSRHSEATGKAALENAGDLAQIGIAPLPKTLIADLSKLPNLPGKLEGLAIVDWQTLAVVNDNDFGFKGFDHDGNAISDGVKSRLVLIRLPQALAQ